MKKAKTIKIFPAPHVEIRLHVSEEMEGTIICRFSTFKREMLRQLGLEQE